jgi:hypothetical protein
MFGLECQRRGIVCQYLRGVPSLQTQTKAKQSKAKQSKAKQTPLQLTYFPDRECLAIAGSPGSPGISCICQTITTHKILHTTTLRQVTGKIKDWGLNLSTFKLFGDVWSLFPKKGYSCEFSLCFGFCRPCILHRAFYTIILRACICTSLGGKTLKTQISGFIEGIKAL